MNTNPATVAELRLQPRKDSRGIYHLFIDGRWVEAAASGAIYPNVNPADRTVVFGQVAESTTDEVQRAVEAARRDFDLWRLTTGDFRTKVFFPDRGEYAFKLEATVGGEALDKYQRVVRVGSALNEGAELAVDHAFLENLAGRSGGYYETEENVDKLVGFCNPP